MKLADYDSLVSRVERGEIEGTAEAIQVRMLSVSRECSTALWSNNQLKIDAGCIAARAEEIVRRLMPVVCQRNHTPAEKMVGTYLGHVGVA